MTNDTTQDAERSFALRNFSVRYPKFSLAPLTLEFQPGERVALVGPNGSGKTTTLRALAGRLSGYDGTITFQGRDLRELLPLGRRRIGLLPETLAGYAWMTAHEHLAFLEQIYPEWDAGYASYLAERLRVPLDRKLGSLSKGTRVKLSFVSAESYRPPLLLLDEPTSGLDPVVRGELIDAILSSSGAATGRVVLFSTHILEDVAAVADRVILLVDGQLSLDAPVRDLCAAHGGQSLPRILQHALAQCRRIPS